MVASVIIAGMVATPKLLNELINQRIEPVVAGSFTYDDLDLPTDDVMEVGSWIRANTPTDTLIGSNYFCETRANFKLDCSDPSWWRKWQVKADEAGAFDSFCLVETKQQIGHVQNYLLPAVTDRRFYIQGPGFILGCSQPSEWITERIDLSESFARMPDDENCSKLVDAGVEFFVVDRRTTDRESWDGFATEKLSNQSFRVLELKKEFCKTS
jgi:hypothetical protein